MKEVQEKKEFDNAVGSHMMKIVHDGPSIHLEDYTEPPKAKKSVVAVKTPLKTAKKSIKISAGKTETLGAPKESDDKLESAVAGAVVDIGEKLAKQQEAKVAAEDAERAKKILESAKLAPKSEPIKEKAPSQQKVEPAQKVAAKVAAVDAPSAEDLKSDLKIVESKTDVQHTHYEKKEERPPLGIKEQHGSEKKVGIQATEKHEEKFAPKEAEKKADEPKKAEEAKPAEEPKKDESSDKKEEQASDAKKDEAPKPVEEPKSAAKEEPAQKPEEKTEAPVEKVEEPAKKPEEKTQEPAKAEEKPKAEPAFAKEEAAKVESKDIHVSTAKKLDANAKMRAIESTMIAQKE